MYILITYRYFIYLDIDNDIKIMILKDIVFSNLSGL